MNKKILSLILVLVSVGAGVYFRFYPKFLPYFNIVASQEIINSERAAIGNAVKEKYPDLPFMSQVKIVDEIYKQDSKASKDRIARKIVDRSNELKSRYKDPNGHIFLNGIDSYYWFRLLNNLLKTGHIGDRVANGVEYDDLIGNPIDAATKNNVHIWLGWTFYKIASVFHRGIELQEALFYIPIFLSCILAIFSFYVSKKLGANDLGAFFASIAITLSPFLLSRSIGEWFDTDIYNVLFPLLAFGVFLYAFGNRKIFSRLFFSCLAGLFLAFYASTWKGWWFIFDIMFFSGLLFLLNQDLTKEEIGLDPAVLKGQLISLGFFFVFTSFFVILFNGFFVWKDFISEPLRLFTVLKVTTTNMWPNVYWTVAELAPFRPLDVVNVLGGNWIFLGSLLGLSYILLAEKGLRDNRHGFSLLCLILWIISTFYCALSASRFALLLVVPIGLAFGLTISKLYESIAGFSQKYLKGKWIFVVRGTCVFLFSLYLISNTMTVHAQLINSMPMIDSYWYRVLTKIKNETPKDSIINSWWDFGHWFKAIAERKVLFDGMTQDTPYAYWIANVLLTDKEEDAVGILRMINTTDSKAIDFLQAQGFPLWKAVELVRKVHGEPLESAGLELQKNLPKEKAQELIKILFPKKLPPVYFIVSYDMIGKIGPISYIGNWDFRKIDMWVKHKKLSRLDFLSYLVQTYGYKREEAEKKSFEISLLSDLDSKQWFSSQLGYFSGFASSKQDGKLLFFDNGLVINQEDNHSYILSDYTERRGVPNSVISFEKGSFKQIPQKDPNFPFSALLIKEGKEYRSVLLDLALAKSIMFRLYFFHGEGLKYFKLWHKEVDDKGNIIYVYKIEWPQESVK